MAQKISAAIVYFFAGMNAGAYLLQQAGIDKLLGISVATGGAKKTQQLGQQYQSVPTGPDTGETMIGMYTTVTQFFTDISTYIFPAMDLLENVGVPNFWITFATTIAGIAFAFNVASFLKGVDL